MDRPQGVGRQADAGREVREERRETRVESRNSGQISVLLEPRFDGFFEELLQGVWLNPFQLTFERGPLEGSGEVGADAGGDG